MSCHHHESTYAIRLVTLLFLAASTTGSYAEKRLLDVDSVRPSAGPHSHVPLSPPGKILVDVDESGFRPDSVTSFKPAGSIDSPASPKTPTAALVFTGVTQSPSLDGGFLYKPPDTHIAVGPGAGASGRVVEVTNSGIQIFNKLGTSVAGPTDLDAFLGGTGAGMSAIGAGNFGFDPKVLYDQHSGRFFVVILDGKVPNPGGRSNVWIAVSSSGTPGNLTTDWTRMSGSALTTIGGVETWFDYPGIGADATSLFITGNLFDAGGVPKGAKIRRFDKSALLSGSYTFADVDVDAAVTPGSSTIQPAHVYGTTDSGRFYLINRFGSGAYRLWTVTSVPVPLSVTGVSLESWVGGTQIVTGAPQSGVTGIPIDTLSSRIINAVYRAGHVWCCLSSDMDSDLTTEVRWFKIATNGGFPAPSTIADHGIVDGSASNKWAFLPSIGVSASGNAMICFSQSASDQFVDMRVAARHSTDPVTTFQSSVVVATSAGEYDDFSATSPERWGDYSACVTDPDDDETFWVGHEVCQTARVSGDDARWGTRIARMDVVVPVPVALSRFSIE